MIHFAINSGYYCEIKTMDINQKELTKIKNRMVDIIEGDSPFVKSTVHLNTARDIFKAQNMKDKINLFKYRKASNVNLYQLDGFYDYFYGYMVPSTGYLNCFDLFEHEEGLILQFTERSEPGVVATFKPDEQLFRTLLDSMKWASIMDIFDVGSLNNMVAKGEANETILVMEALMEKRIGQIADQIASDIKSKKFVFIAGPSSSGKTTFAHRLGIQLKAHGIKPYVISVDNYFKRREETPKDVLYLCKTCHGLARDLEMASRTRKGIYTILYDLFCKNTPWEYIPFKDRKR
jgi:uridine kinase